MVFRALFIRFSSLGDIVLTSGVINYTRKLALSLGFERCEIGFLTYEQFGDVVKCFYDENGSLLVDELITVKRKSDSLSSQFSNLRSSLSSYDVVFDLHGGLKSYLVQWFTNGFSKGKFFRYNKESLSRRLYVTFRMYSYDLEHHTLQRYLRCVLAYFDYAKFGVSELSFDTVNLELLRPSLRCVNSGIDYAKYAGYTLILPSASKKMKGIHPVVLDEMLTKLMSFGNVANSNNSSKILLVADKVEDGIVEVVKKHNVECIIGGSTIIDLVGIISVCSNVITGDSANLHIAIGFHKNVYAVFESTSKEFGFYPRNAVK